MKHIRILFLLSILSLPQFYYACSPLAVPTLVNQSISGSNLVLNFQANTIYLCPNNIDVELACNTGTYSGSAAFTYTSATVTGATSPYTYPTMNIPIGSLCAGTVYKFRFRERNNSNAAFSAWSGNFTFTTPGAAAPAPTMTLTSSASSICVNGSSNLGAVTVGCGPGPKTYAWSPTTALSCVTCSNPVASPTVTTVYTATVTGGQLGCWSISRSTTITVGNCTLPIELISFDADVIDDAINVKWATASEKNNKSFSVLRSEDGINFETIAVLPGSGSSNSAKRYNYIDKKVEPGRAYYYRLQQTDYNNSENIVGRTVYAISQKKNFVVDVFPNPASDELYIVSEKDLNNVTVEMFDCFGHKVKAINNVSIIRNEKFALNISDVINGCYQLVVLGNETLIQKKVVTYK